jgi:hypothetical protein
MTVKLAGGGGDQPRFDIDGRLQFEPVSDEMLVPTLSGTGRLAAGAPVLGRSGNPVPVTVTAALKSAGRTIGLTDIAFEAGEGASALRLGGSGRFELDKPLLSLAVDGRRFDLDAFLIAQGKDTQKPTPALWPRSASVPVDLSFKLDSLSFAGEEWNNLSAAGSLSRGRIRLDRAAVAAPGTVQVGASGEFGTSFASGGSGHVTLAGRSGERLGAVLGRLGFGEALAGVFDGRSLDAQADVVVAEPVASLRNLRIALGDATLSGAVRYTSPDWGARGRLDAQIALQGLDLMRAPSAGGLFAAARDLDLGLILDARGVGYGTPKGTGRIAARLASEGPSLRVDRLEIVDLAGANANVSGRIAADGTGRIEGRVTASRAAPLLDLAGSAWLGGVSTLLPSFLREGDLDLSVLADRAADATGPGLRAVLKGTAAAGRFEAETVSTGGQLRSLQASLAAERLGRWFGRSDAPGLERPARLHISGARAGGSLGLTLEGDLGGIALRTKRPLALGRDERTIESGAATLAADDISALASVAGLAGGGPAVPAQLEIGFGRQDDQLQVTAKGRLAGTDVDADLSGASLAEIRGNLRLGRLSFPWLASAFALNGAPPAPGGIWASARFGPAPAATLAGRIAIRAASLDLGAGLTGADATGDLAISDEGLRLRNMDLAFAGGRLGGEFTIARQGGLASLTGQGQVRDVDLVQLLGAAAFEGRISGDLRFGGSGESAAAIVGNLGGAGNVGFSNLEVAQADAGAVTRAAARALRSDDPLASARLQETTAEELGRGALNLGAISAPATLVAGVLRVGPVRADMEAAFWQGTLNLDLRSLTLDARGMLQAKAAPRGWTGDAPAVVLGWQGPVSRPARILDVAPLTNGLASVVLARELDRIDTFEADQNERQRRNGQQQMEAERRAAAEAAARRAREEAARRAREEAARAAAAERARAEREQAERAARFERGDPGTGPAPFTTFPQPARPAPPPGG